MGEDDAEPRHWKIRIMPLMGMRSDQNGKATWVTRFAVLPKRTADSPWL